MRASLLLAFGWIALLAACAAPGRTVTGAHLPPAEELPQLRRIAALEDARAGTTALLDCLRDEDARVRTRAAEALGRMPPPSRDADSSRALQLALTDEAAEVRAAAAFALGMRADASAAERLLALALDSERRDMDPLVRARALEAASKLPTPALRERFLEGLTDPDPRVRLEAAQGVGRWSGDEPAAELVNRFLAARLVHETDRDVILYGLASLERRKAKAALPLFVEFARNGSGDTRLFAVRGLRALAPHPDVVPELHSVLASRDWRVVCEAALGLAACDGEVGQEALAQLTRHANAHVRRSAWEALAQRADRATSLAQATELFERLSEHWLDRTAFQREPSLSVRAAFLEIELPLMSRLRELGPGWNEDQRQAMVERARELARQEPPVVLAGIARACGRIGDTWAERVAVELAANASPFVAGQAIEALGKHASPSARARLREWCAHPDNGLRLAAVQALAESPQPDDLQALERAFRASSGDIAPEIRFNCVRAAAKLGGPAALAFVREAELAGMRERSFLVQVAREELEKAWKEPPAHPPVAEPQVDPASFPLPGDGRAAWTKNPVVALETERGTLVFELFPREAPLHVASFLELVERRAYDGLTIHRVVPGFVAQGGDYRGDGNGGKPAFAEALRHEITPRKYVRGALGMPRNDDWDSGGSQFFVTHRPTPHLDGRYTIFGQLRDGEAALDALEVGDRILYVRRR